MKARKIICGIVIVCAVITLVYFGIWGMYWLRCDKYRDQLVDIYGMEYVKLEECSYYFSMPDFGRFNAYVCVGEYIDLDEAGRNHVERVEVPSMYMFFEFFDKIVVASQGSVWNATGVDEKGNYTYTVRADYFELDENLKPLDEKSAKVWERIGDSYDSLIARINEVWGFFE